mmetsp:Transcript_28541/g.93728  ORF Transcript_28541/g.93728 Transcript_28541/m.93728 type:complete len:228 (+) Transcript_28541:39-722(+)
MSTSLQPRSEQSLVTGTSAPQAERFRDRDTHMGGGGLIILANATRRGTKASSSRRYRCSSTYRRCRRCRHRSLCISMRLCRIRCPPRGSRPCPRSGRSGTPRVGSRRRLLERCLNPLQRRLRLVQRRIGLCTRRPGLRPRNLDFRQRRLGSRLFLLVCIRLLLRLVRRSVQARRLGHLCRRRRLALRRDAEPDPLLVTLLEKPHHFLLLGLLCGLGCGCLRQHLGTL